MMLQSAQQLKGSGFTKLHFAAMQNDMESTVQLLGSLDDANTLNLKSKQGDAPLHTALRASHVDLARLLVESGADVFLRGFRSESVMHICGGSLKQKTTN